MMGHNGGCAGRSARRRRLQRRRRWISGALGACSSTSAPAALSFSPTRATTSPRSTRSRGGHQSRSSVRSKDPSMTRTREICWRGSWSASPSHGPNPQSRRSDTASSTPPGAPSGRRRSSAPSPRPPSTRAGRASSSRTAGPTRRRARRTTAEIGVRAFFSSLPTSPRAAATSGSMSSGSKAASGSRRRSRRASPLLTSLWHASRTSTSGAPTAVWRCGSPMSSGNLCSR
mmetsp:Transcript_15159/g.49719  ORF Transcript_15159/g.49719 Transcript_15159/m.49719 type:complete len:230 (-) Transcript_15159:308-997(-)